MLAFFKKAKELLEAFGLITFLAAAVVYYVKSEAIKFQQMKSLKEELDHNIKIISDIDTYPFKVCGENYSVSLRIIQSTA
jgi:hypothetical protein